MQLRDVQARLIELGYNLGPSGADNTNGPKTRAAIAAFQRDRAIPVTWPGTIDLRGGKTLQALFGAPQHVEAESLLVPWYAEATRRLGLHETRNKIELSAWLKSDGATLGDPAALPWCGDFVETAIALTLPNEPLPVNPYLARNWLKFGVPLAFPALGAIAVFWRGSKTGTSGHVGFVRARRAGALLIRGGNQSNSVSDAWLDNDPLNDRLLGLRWPATFDPPLAMASAPLVTSNEQLSTNEA